MDWHIILVYRGWILLAFVTPLTYICGFKCLSLNVNNYWMGYHKHLYRIVSPQNEL